MTAAGAAVAGSPAARPFAAHDASWTHQSRQQPALDHHCALPSEKLLVLGAEGLQSMPELLLQVVPLEAGTHASATCVE